MLRALAAIVLIALVTQASSTSARRERCALHQGYKLLVKTSHSVIERRMHNRGRLRGWTFRGCLESVDRWRTLGVGQVTRDRHGHDLSHGALGGRFAAFDVDTYHGRGPITRRIKVVNLRTGHRHAPFLAGRTGGDNGPRYALHFLRVSRYATVAWLGDQFGSQTDPPQWHITAHDAAGTRVLESGKPHSFSKIRFRGSRLEWRHLDRRRSVDLGRR
jgi:hypothetical protein